MSTTVPICDYLHTLDREPERAGMCHFLIFLNGYLTSIPLACMTIFLVAWRGENCRHWRTSMQRYQTPTLPHHLHWRLDIYYSKCNHRISAQLRARLIAAIRGIATCCKTRQDLVGIKWAQPSSKRTPFAHEQQKPHWEFIASYIHMIRQTRSSLRWQDSLA